MSKYLDPKAGRAEGEYNKAIVIARKLKEAGVDLSIIVASTGLAPDEITSM